jgi:hypothetical protein
MKILGEIERLHVDFECAVLCGGFGGDAEGGWGTSNRRG